MVVAIVAAGAGIAGIFLLRRFEKMFAASQREMERRLAALTESISMHEPVSADAVPVTDVLGAAEMEGNPPAGMRSPVGPHGNALGDAEHAELPTQSQGKIPPDIQVAIAAAAIAAFGDHARVRSARRIPSSDVVSPWTQQGRVIVQSSHNLRTRG